MTNALSTQSRLRRAQAQNRATRKNEAFGPGNFSKYVREHAPPGVRSGLYTEGAKARPIPSGGPQHIAEQTPGGVRRRTERLI